MLTYYCWWCQFLWQHVCKVRKQCNNSTLSVLLVHRIVTVNAWIVCINDWFSGMLLIKSPKRSGKTYWYFLVIFSITSYSSFCPNFVRITTGWIVYFEDMVDMDVKLCNCRGQKFHSSARNYEWNLERMRNSSQSTHPTGQVLWEKLLVEVILHITPLCSDLHMLLKDKCMYLQGE